MKIERMSDEDQESRKNTLSSANVTQLTNVARDNKEQKSSSKIIQDFENLFYQELVNIERANKMFVA